MAQGIRRRVLEHVIRANSGYLSQACSSAEILATLYTRILNLGPSQAPMIPPAFPGVPSADNHQHVSGGIYNGPKAAHLDRFILSPTHYALSLYAALIEAGRMSPEGLAQFNEDGSSLEMIGGEHSPGLEVTGGSFGQALGQAAGIAWARKRRGDAGKVWMFMSDGEFQEGMTWESFLVMKHHHVDNIKIFVDVNGQQVDGRMEQVMNIEPFQDKLEAFGAKVYQVDGHDVDALAEASQIEHPGQPLVILACTIPYRGMTPLEARYPNLHFIRFKSPEEREHYRAFLETMEA
jgi:transketolase